MKTIIVTDKKNKLMYGQKYPVLEEFKNGYFIGSNKNRQFIFKKNCVECLAEGEIIDHEYYNLF